LLKIYLKWTIFSHVADKSEVTSHNLI